jgi:hypothetical protein
VIVQRFRWRSPGEGFARSAVEPPSDSSKVIGTVQAEICPLREVLAKQPIRVLVGSTLSRALPIAEEDLQASVDTQLRMLPHLGTLVPCERTTQLLGPRVTHSSPAMTPDGNRWKID